MSRMFEHNEEQERAALSIAVQAGVLKRCEYHPDFLFEGGNEIESAYKKGVYKFKHENELKELFHNTRELTDRIKSVVQDNGGVDECQRCVHLMKD